MVRKVLTFILCLALLPVLALADELIVNGDFSSTDPNGVPGWVTATSATAFNPNVHTDIVQPPPQGGAAGNVCVVPGNSGGGYSYSYIQQMISIPRDALGTTLTFYYQWFVGHPYSVWTYLDGHFGTAGNNILIMTEPTPMPSPSYYATPTPGWTRVQKYVELKPFGGQKVVLQFRSTDDSVSDPNFMLLDDVSMDVITATKTNTPTISPTPSITPTITITPTVSPTPTMTPTYTITPTRTITPTITPWVASTGEAPAFPNPARGGQVTFIYSLESPADVAVDIFNALGFKVAHLEDKHKLGTSNQQTTWNIQSVAPGVYLYQVTVKYNTGQVRKMKIQRVAIVK